MATFAIVDPPSSFSFTTPFNTPSFAGSVVASRKTAMAAAKRIVHHSFGEAAGDG